DEGRAIERRSIDSVHWERLQCALNNNPPDLDYLENIVSQEMTFINAMENVALPNDICEALHQLSSLLDLRNKPPPSIFVVRSIGPRGRFRLQVTEDHLQSLLHLGLPATCVADILGVSRRTIYRRMQEYNMSVRSLYSTMTDDALDNEVRDIKSRLPHAGYQIVKGCLEAEGHHVQWTRLKASMHRVDTEGILSRMTSMGCPHFLQHIDNNHKLIRYNMVIFGGIDGYLRKIMYLNAGSNNTANTALQFFLDGVRRFGWPYNLIDPWGTFLCSNCRIERLWRDIWTGVTHIYYDVLHSLEEDGSLDISDNLHLFCAQYTFLPRLKADLAKFSAGWNDHPIRTEGFLTPNQLWELGMLQHPIRKPETFEENVAVE
uniref:Resolvase HTH domain-containing protein n=1 Tax=Esox lucius TaxID=8010 RepID=A0A6Q2XMV9_ESOLU